MALISEEKRKAIEKLGKEIKEKRKIARSALSSELKKSRKRKCDLKWQVVHLESFLERKSKEHERTSRHELARRLVGARARIQNIKTAERDAVESLNNRINDYIGLCKYPCPPVGNALPTTQGVGVPIAPGIYFLWNSGKCESVGKSINLNQRLRLRTHHVLQQHHTLSWIVFPKYELDWMECYYIGVVRPQLNFGQNANHKQLLDQG